jgi:hypothetical protein
MASPSRNDRSLHRTARTAAKVLYFGLLGIAMLLAPATAPAQDDDPQASSVSDGFSVSLEAAKALYFAGDLEKSVLAFRALQLQIAQSPEAMPWEEAVDALTYLGEILVKTGDDDGARRAFRAILERDVETRISPYHHPVEVVFVFNRVKEQVEAERLAEISEPVPVPRAPVSTYLPLGIPQLARGRLGAGLAFGGGQLVVGGAALGVYSHLWRLNGPDPNNPDVELPEQIEDRIRLRRYAVQWPTTFAFYGLWAGSVIEARGHWKRTHASPTVLVIPGAGGAPGLTIAGSLP